jgi:transposase
MTTPTLGLAVGLARPVGYANLQGQPHRTHQPISTTTADANLKMGSPSLPPGRYFRMHMVGYFEGIASERGIAWRCSDSMSLRDFLRLENREEVPDHSWLSKTRGRLPHEVHETVFGWVLQLVAEQGLVKGKRIGVDASTMEANAALRTIVRREDGRSYREMLTQMAKESGIATPTADDLVRIDRNRKGKRLSNEEWTSQTDPEAKMALP